MPWVKLDDGFAEHPKVVNAGPLAVALHVSALCYCSRQLTDGLIPDAMLGRLLDLSGIVQGIVDEQFVDADSQVYPTEIAADLVSAGIWKKVPKGYLIHDYLDYNPSREEVLAKRRTKEIQSAGGKARAAGGERDQHGRFVSAGEPRNSPADDQQDGPGYVQVYPAPGPEPDPVPHPHEIQLLAPDGAQMNGMPKSANGMQTYLVERLRLLDDFTKEKLPWSAIVKLNGQFGRPLVTTALQFLREAPPQGPVDNPIAYLTATIRSAQEQVGEAP